MSGSVSVKTVARDMAIDIARKPCGIGPDQDGALGGAVHDPPELVGHALGPVIEAMPEGHAVR